MVVLGVWLGVGAVVPGGVVLLLGGKTRWREGLHPNSTVATVRLTRATPQHDVAVGQSRSTTPRSELFTFKTPL
jgi:hypothetical protein